VKPVVLIDGTALGPNVKGVGRYAWQLLEAVSELDGVLTRCVIFEGRQPRMEPPGPVTWIPIPYHSEFALGMTVMPALIRGGQAAVFVRPADKIGRRYGVPTVTVCHDINPLIWREQPAAPLRRRLLDWCWEWLRGRGLSLSDHVMCNSKFVRQRAIDRFALQPDKTSVGYCGVDPEIPRLAAGCNQTALRQRFGGRGFLLAFATGDEREGFRILPDLFRAARAAGYPGHLVVGGVNEHAPYSRWLREQWGPESAYVHEQPFLGEKEKSLLAGLYAGADFYLETSRHEGFGMQLVEAMACGTTCFSSGRGALTEVGGEFPLPLPIDNPAAAGRMVAGSWKRDVHRRDNIRQVAYAKSFDWQQTRKIVREFVANHLPSSAHA